nr:MAG TPA_asm: hypothetical protein [Caudoviricetes sp.]
MRTTFVSNKFFQYLCTVESLKSLKDTPQMLKLRF